MKTTIFLIVISLFLIIWACKSKTGTPEVSDNTIEKQNIYQFKVKDLSGNEFDFASLKGKKIMVVNTASKCGLTPQYTALEAIYEKYKDQNFVIIGFPANNFLWQEPGTNEEIGAFCSKNYGVTFPMMSKISVKGSDMHEIYQFLTQKAKNGLKDSDVSWNFQKYLINENGELDKVISPRTVPTDPEIINWIEQKSQVKVTETAINASGQNLHRVWMLTEFQNFKKEDLVKLEAKLDLTNPERAAAKMGCNNLSFGYKTIGNSEIIFSQGIATKMYCEGRMGLENKFSTEITTIKTYKLEGQKLILSDDKNQIMVFVAQDWD
jgi:glutathione peroxidase